MIVDKMDPVNYRIGGFQNFFVQHKYQKLCYAHKAEPITYG